MTFIPQYAKTTDPEVVEAITSNAEGRAKFNDDACAFASKHGADKGAFYPSRFMGSHSIRAIAVKKRPTEGQWAQGHRGYGFRPRKGTDLAAEMDAIRFDEQKVPGLVRGVEGPTNRDGGMQIASPTVFVQDGIAYAGLPFLPARDQGGTFADPGDPAGYGDQWEEVKAGEYMTALDAYNDARKADAA